MAPHTSIHPDQLPPTIRSFLTAHAARDSETAMQAFSPDAVVVDQDETYRGATEVLGFLRHAGAEFEYTTELVGAGRVDDEHWLAINRLEGDFPGGEADLTYRFAVDGERITELVISG